MRTQWIAVALLDLRSGSWLCRNRAKYRQLRRRRQLQLQPSPRRRHRTPRRLRQLHQHAASQAEAAAAPSSAEDPGSSCPGQASFPRSDGTGGHELPLELTTALSSETAKSSRLLPRGCGAPVVVDGLTVFPAGAVFHGNVTEVERAGRVSGRSHLAFRFTEVTIDEQRDPVSTHSVSFEGEATKSEDATKVGAGAGIGAVIGGIVGGGKGAAKGAVIGGAAGAGTVLATRGRDVELAAGSEVNATLASPFGVRVELE